MKSFKWIIGYLKKYKVRYIAALALVLFTAVINMIIPFLSGTIVDKVIVGKEINLLIPILLLMIFIVVFKGIIAYSFQIMFEKISQSILLEIRTDLYEKLLNLDFKFYSSHKTGDIMARMTGDIDALRHFIAWVVYSILSSVSIFIFAIISMVYVSPILTFFMLLVCPVIGYLAYKMSGKIAPTFHGVREAYSSLNSVVQENISGNRVVRAFGREDFEVEKFTKQNVNYKEKNLDTLKVTQKYIPKLEFLSNSLSVVMILVGGILAINKSITLGELVIFNSLLWALNNPMRMCGYLINDTQRFIASSTKIMELLNTESTIKNSENIVNPQKIKGDIRFDNVSFSLDGKDILKNLSFTVKAGETIGMVGHTGSGKSTIINLLSRFYDPTEGDIYLDNVNIKEMDIDILRGAIGTAMQDIFLFSDTIKENIAYGNQEATIEEVKEIAKISQAHGFINGMEDSYETIVGERGVGLSGGQKQRISLARAMMKNSPIFILDDVTSAVDMETEKKIQYELKNIEERKTTFIIAHRISSVRPADLILVLNNGKIIESGKHDELIESKGYYYRIFKTQYGDFNIEEEVI